MANRAPPPVGRVPLTLLVHDTLPSTSTQAARLAAEGAPDGTVVLAHRQSAGRGRRGRGWIGMDGNLFASLILRGGPMGGGMADGGATGGGAPRMLGWLAFAVAVAVMEGAALLNPAAAGELSIKWPNDVMRRGAKLAGLLLETTDEAVVVGMGLNLCAAPHGAASLFDGDQTAPAPDAALRRIWPSISHWVSAWRQGDTALIATRWVQCAHPPGTPLVVRPGAEVLRGCFAGLTEQGGLRLRVDGGGERIIHAGEVFLSDQAMAAAAAMEQGT